MAFIVTKKVRKNGKVYTYRYKQRSVRIGKKVKSIHLGAVSSDYIAGQERADRAYASAMRQAEEMDAYQRATFGRTGAEAKAAEAKAAEFNSKDFLAETAGPAEEKDPAVSEVKS